MADHPVQKTAPQSTPDVPIGIVLSTSPDVTLDRLAPRESATGVASPMYSSPMYSSPGSLVADVLIADVPIGTDVPIGIEPEQEAAVQHTWPLGRGRPPLDVQDLPEPEQVFQVRRIGLQELILIVLGPAVIALGLSIGSGEWMLGPLNVGRYGFRGIFWVVLVSILLQVFYNVELGRYTLATGESPVVGFARTPPGPWLWAPLAILSFYMAFILGGWATSAGSSLFTILTGRISHISEIQTIRYLAIGLMVLTIPILAVGRKIERTLEAVQGLFLPYILIGLLLVTLVVVPADFWLDGLLSLVTPSRPPAGTDVSLLGALAGFAALASGLNYMFIGYYRDKGYAMGARVGFIPGLIGGSPPAAGQPYIRPNGITFPEDEPNAARWRRWFRFLLIDQWAVYFPGVLAGMLLPSILVGYLIITSQAAPPDQNSIIIYAANQLSARYGPILGSWALIVGFVILFSTQIVVLELLARNLTDALFGLSQRVQRWTGGDPRRVYYPLLLLLVALVSGLIHLALPGELIVISANLSNFAALIFPLVLIYLNTRLPRPARAGVSSVLVLLLNALFFGFFFINFVFLLITGAPLLRF